MNEQIKPCTKCKTDKPHADFQRNKSNKDGLQDWCRDCLNARMREVKAKRKAAVL